MIQDLINWAEGTGIDIVHNWLGVAGRLIETYPWFLGISVGLLCLTGLYSRSFSFTLGSLVCSAMAVASAGMFGPSPVWHGFAIAIVFIQILMLTGSFEFRRHLYRERSSKQKLLSEMRAVQQSLDEEIRWRRASKENGSDPLP